ncbi:MAG TPA: Gfo/Idh/MocA family oxidoreductase [Pyrinomonadaceae bacterium]|nr:Gfo/Idh/MocA family oxidoreductase [Pyrinomonadaceae bacterium]
MKNLTRRDFVKTAGSAAAVVLTQPSLASVTSARRRYAIVGTGDRATSMWGRPLVQKYSDVVEFVGLCDINPKRVAVAKELIGVQCPTFTNFDQMIAQAKPDLLMVTTVDGFHSEFITKGLDRGLDVMTEKPMVIDEQQCRAVLAAEKRNQKKIVVTFNYRYSPKHQKIKEILMSGAIGRVISVDFSWYLDVSHGADYFRRWHRLKSKGGSLWVHKASHHFDLINWWLDADPVEVSAQGGLEVYGKRGPFRHTHCRPCPHKGQCRFYYDLTKSERRMKLYAGPEDVDGYHRDGCVFREDVDIYDTMSAVVKYSNGASMSYSLNAFMPFEGYRLAFNGELGRLETREYERQPWPVEEETEMYLTKSFGKREQIIVPKVEGGHGGGDTRLQDLMFRKTDAPVHMRLPDSRAGAMSCLTGIAARKSIETKRPVKIAELASL